MAILKPGQLASGSYTISGSFSGSFQGSGAGLNNIPSSAIVGLSSTQIASGAVSASVSTGTGSFTVTSGSSTFMFISSSGNVGLGTTTPSRLLHVSEGGTRLSQTFNPGVPTLYVYHGRTENDSTVRFENASGDNLYFGGNGLFVTGNTTIGNGSTTLSARLGVKGSGTTSATTSLLVQNSTGTNILQVRDDGVLRVNSIANLDGTGLVKVPQYLVAQADPFVFKNSSNVDMLYMSTAASSFQTPVTLGLSFGINPNASAQLQINSTTKGFLPPRTNLTSNISTPAQGLMTYVTASATEGLYYYNSGSAVGWHKVLTNSGSQDISGSLGVTGSISVTSGNIILNSNRIYLGNNATQMLYTSGADVYLENGATSRKIIFNNTSAGVFQFNNGNVLINTTTDSGFKLDINGTTRIQGATTLANELMKIDNSAQGSNSTILFPANSPFFYANTYAFNFGATSNGGGAAFTNGVLQVWNQLNLNNLLILSDGNSTANERLRVTKGGNVLINTTTDAGYKLDVNGTARVSGNVTLGNWSNNNTLYGSTNASWILAQHQSILLDRPGNERGSVNISTNAYLNAAGDWKYTKTGNSAAANYFLFEGTHLFRVAAAGTIDATINWINSIYINSTGAVAIGTTSTNASAQLQVDSTTKGFLPPRMTGAQAELISSPAEGLMIYATAGTGTTITSKGWWGYDGATWVKFN